MADPGDPHTDDDHDDRIGFSSAASLTGRRRASEAVPDPVEPPLPAWAIETPAPVAPTPVAPVARDPAFGRRDVEAADVPQGAMGLYAVYALILFAVPTFGVSALVGLAAVVRRPVPEQEPAASHFVYQRRTLLAAGAAAAIGAVLILVSLGVFVLFAMAAWVVARGGAGVFRLKAGRPINDPRGWWI